jgi:hypothetical protein
MTAYGQEVILKCLIRGVDRPFAITPSHFLYISRYKTAVSNPPKVFRHKKRKDLLRGMP